MVFLQSICSITDYPVKVRMVISIEQGYLTCKITATCGNLIMHVFAQYVLNIPERILNNDNSNKYEI